MTHRCCICGTSAPTVERRGRRYCTSCLDEKMYGPQHPITLLDQADARLDTIRKETHHGDDSHVS